MYLRVGQHPQARRLMTSVAGLNFTARPSGYLITEKQQTIEAFRKLLSNTFPGEWINARCAVLKADSMIPLHKDSQDAAAVFSRRLLVVQTNPDAWALHDGTWQHLAEDGIYEMNPQMFHAAVNWGTEPRVHLIVDTR